MLHPGDDLPSFVGLLHGEMNHGMAGCGAVPVFFAGCEPCGVAGGEAFDLRALALRVADTAEDEDHLASRMRVPCGACACGKGDDGAALSG